MLPGEAWFSGRTSVPPALPALYPVSAATPLKVIVNPLGTVMIRYPPRGTGEAGSVMVFGPLLSTCAGLR
jgi:hypothetical protein